MGRFDITGQPRPTCHRCGRQVDKIQVFPSTQSTARIDWQFVTVFCHGEKEIYVSHGGASPVREGDGVDLRDGAFTPACDESPSAAPPKAASPDRPPGDAPRPEGSPDTDDAPGVVDFTERAERRSQDKARERMDELLREVQEIHHQAGIRSIAIALVTNDGRYAPLVQGFVDVKLIGAISIASYQAHDFLVEAESDEQEDDPDDPDEDDLLGGDGETLH